MSSSSPPFSRAYAELLRQVAKPPRYLGGEYLSVEKDAGSVDVRMVLAFPDVYEVGMSHLGTRILYSLLNRHPRIACERAFSPWPDMEAKLREHGLPLVSLESGQPLAAFDVVGISLQYELAFTNVLTLLDLGGIPLRACERDARHPLVLGGGPVATHPEPVAPFFDAFFVGEAEERLPDLLLEWKALRQAGRPREEALAELATRYPLYVPGLYQVAPAPESGVLVVGQPRRSHPAIPTTIRRAYVADLDAFPYPVDSPVPFAEVVFDRASVEIARGCTEGCRFCEAGIIYRPARERRPDAVVEALVGAVRTGGYDEASLTSLSTADYSCLGPLVVTAASRLREHKASLAVSSLRAYGLDEQLLAELSSVRATGLTFAPEAGTQRLRDVVNKNVSTAQIMESAERVFAAGYRRMKLYFMIGLPTERDEDLAAIVDVGAAVAKTARRLAGRGAVVTVSVSSFVPKPHTPFQWCPMDSLAELERKQALLLELAGKVRPPLELKYHERALSHLEGMLARGDRRFADVIEDAWRDGARFDAWEEQLDLGRWQRAIAQRGLDTASYVGGSSHLSRLPWDHIDAGVSKEFLANEYHRALAAKTSPPCGKPYHDVAAPGVSLATSRAEQQKLVCYRCGLDCDLEKLQSGRVERAQLVSESANRSDPFPRHQHEDDGKRQGHRRTPSPQFTQGEGRGYRIRYRKLGRPAFISHLDTARLIGRALRRAGIDVVYSLGFHPRPQLSFGPALGLGIPSLGEVVDVRIDGSPEPTELLARLNAVSPPGILFAAAIELPAGHPRISRLVDAYDLAFLVDDEVSPEPPRENVLSLRMVPPEVAARLGQLFAWPPSPSIVAVRARTSPGGNLKMSQVAESLGVAARGTARLALVGFDGEGQARDPLGMLLAPEPGQWEYFSLLLGV
ncbi:MAG: TIGR03960 family B12-binding radical SAM protein [Pseudomonadota bacterium]